MKSKQLVDASALLVVVLFAGCGQTKEQPSTSEPTKPGR